MFNYVYRYVTVAGLFLSGVESVTQTISEARQCVPVCSETWLGKFCRMIVSRLLRNNSGLELKTRDGFGFLDYETLFSCVSSSSQLITSALPSCPNSVHDPWSIWNCVMQLMFQEVVVLFYLQCKRCIGQGRHHISPQQEVAYRQLHRCNITSRSVCECLFRNH